jgi:cytochrome b pre-mRNA-processing protein 3
MAMTDGSKALAEAICRNVLDGEGIENARRLVTYVERTMASLSNESDVKALGTSWTFPPPLAGGA